MKKIVFSLIIVSTFYFLVKKTLTETVKQKTLLLAEHPVCSRHNYNRIKYSN